MDIVTQKYKDLLKICMEKKISLDTIQQIIALRDMKNPDQAVERLLKRIDSFDEKQLIKEIGKILKEQYLED